MFSFLKHVSFVLIWLVSKYAVTVGTWHSIYLTVSILSRSDRNVFFNISVHVCIIVAGKRSLEMLVVISIFSQWPIILRSRLRHFPWATKQQPTSPSVCWRNSTDTECCTAISDQGNSWTRSKLVRVSDNNANINDTQLGRWWHDLYSYFFDGKLR